MSYRPGEKCPDHDIPYPCPVGIEGHWLLEDSDEDWYVVRPWDAGRVGPFTEEEAGKMLPLLRERYPMEKV